MPDQIEQPGTRPEASPCGDELIHEAHIWEAYEQPDPEDAPDFWAPVDRYCEGNADQDDPLYRYECCDHCGAATCPRRDGHIDPCKAGCHIGSTMLGEPYAC